MNLLAIDTALERCSVGVIAGEAGPVLLTETIGRGHAERLFAQLTEAMAEAGLAFADLDRIAVTVGPGSFTGLRVGIAAARGIALVVGCPVVGIGTLAVLAETARAKAGPAPVLALIDAGRGEIYGQLFDANGEPATPPEIASPGNLAARLDKDIRLAGSGAPLVAAGLGPGGVVRIVHRDTGPEIGALVRLGLTAPAQAAPPRPLYLRPPDAKPQTAAAVERR